MRLLLHPEFLPNWLIGAVKGFSSDNCTLMAAAISYYVLFSVFPLLIFSVGIVGIVLQDQELQRDLVDEVMANIPLTEDEGRNDIANAIENVSQTSSGAVGLIGLVTMAWSGSNMFGAVRRSLNIAYGAETPRPPVRQKLIDLMMVVLFAPLFLASLAATTALRVARNASADVPVLGPLADDLGGLWWLASIAVPMIFTFCAFVFLYRLIPARRFPLRFVLPSAIIAALLFELVKLGFSVYLENFGNYDVVFGSLGAVVAFMFWVYLSANILLFGAEMVVALPDALRKLNEPKTDKPKQPLGRKVVTFLRSLVFHPKEQGAGNREPEPEEQGTSR